MLTLESNIGSIKQDSMKNKIQKIVSFIKALFYSKKNFIKTIDYIEKTGVTRKAKQE